MKNPLISIIILNFNQIEVTCEFLESCKLLTYDNYEIILVDNASKLNPADRITKEYPQVNFIRSEENLGFTGGNNLGIAAGAGDYFFIVNNDTEVTPNLLELLLAPFDLDENIGMVSPKIKYYASPELVQYAGYTEVNSVTGRNNAVGAKQKDEGQFTSGYTAYAHGAAMLVKKKVIDTVGAFAEDFFIYYEELDWSARAKKAGFKIYFQSEAEILHKESVTMGKESAIKAYYHNRNRFLFMKRNQNAFSFFFFFIFFILLVTPKQLIKYRRNNQPEHYRNFVKGLRWNMTRLFNTQ